MLGFAQKALSLSVHSATLWGVPPLSLRFFQRCSAVPADEAKTGRHSLEKQAYQPAIYNVTDTPAATSAVKIPHTIKSAEPPTLPLLASLEVSVEIACNYASNHKLLPQVVTSLSDYLKI